MKTIDTLRFGQVEYAENEVITFDRGIPGFEEDHQYIIIQPDRKDPFAFLQSLDTPELSFVIGNPFHFHQEYEFDLDEQNKEDLNIQVPEEVIVWGILSIPDEFQKATINLKAPIVINITKMKGKQVILHETQYKVKTPLFIEEVAK